METKTFQAPAIHCGHCTMTIQREVAELAGVAFVKADQNTQRVTVSWQAPASWDKIKALLEEIGYPPAN
jgi:copper chaperone CopZ